MFAEAREKSSDQKLAAAYRQVNILDFFCVFTSIIRRSCERLGGSHCVK